MKSMKKMLAILLALVTVAVCIPAVTVAFAADTAPDLIITEVCFNPAFRANDAGITENEDVLEYVEIYNRSNADVSIADCVMRYAKGYAAESVSQNAIITVFLFSFVWQWTDLFYTRNFLSSYSIFSNQLSTILTRMNYYFSTESGKPVIVPVGRQMQLVSIGILICCVPLIILYIFTQRTFVESIAMSGTKE